MRSFIDAGAMRGAYVGYDPELDREIALELLPREVGEAAAHQQRRLQTEAKMLARLSHPNVIVVHDVGAGDGTVFIAMEYIRGQTLRTWLRARERHWREILRVFCAAGRGLAAAHAAGIVHRDFKPDSVLIGFDERVRVTGFGLAHSVTAPPEIVPGQSTAPVARAAAYVAPEQSEEPNAASDQFSFCMALFEAIYGDPGSAGVTLERLVRPSRRARIPKRVRNALVRGLSPRARDRYPSMDALLDVLEPTAFPLGKVVTVASSIGVLLLMASWTRVDEAHPCDAIEDGPAWPTEARQHVHAMLTNSDRPYAGQAFAQLDAALTRYVSAWSEARARACQVSDERLTARVQCLGQARDRFHAVVGALELADDAIADSVGEVVEQLPRVTLCDERTELATAPTPEDPELAEQVERLRLHLVTARTLYVAGQLDAAASAVEQLLHEAEVLGYPPLHAEVCLTAGAIALMRGRADEAKDALEKAAAIGVASRYRPVTADAWVRLVYVHAQMLHDLQAAERAVELARAELDGMGGERSIEAGLWLNIGSLALVKHELARARDAYQRARVLLREEDTPLDLLDVLSNLATVEARDLHHAKAAELHREVIAGYERLLPPKHPSLLRSRYNLASSLAALGDRERAETMLRRTIEDAEDTLGPGHVQTLASRNSLVVLLNETGRADEAVDAARTLVERVRQHDAHNPVVRLTCETTLMKVLIAAEQMREALELGVEIEPRVKQLDGSAPALEREFLRLKAAALTGLQRPHEALVALEQVLQSSLLHNGPSHWSTARAHASAGEAQLLVGEVAAAVHSLQRAIEIGHGHRDGEAEVLRWREVLADAEAKLRKASR